MSDCCRSVWRQGSRRHLTPRSPPSHFMIEEVVGDLDQTVLSGVIVAAGIAAAINEALSANTRFSRSPRITDFITHRRLFFLLLILGIAVVFVSLLFSESL